jgi:hypothetical protein
LIVVNGNDKCFGVITRYRKTINGIDESIIDFLIVCRRFFNLINRLEIDEVRLVSISDHNLFILNINTTWDTSVDYKIESWLPILDSIIKKCSKNSVRREKK